MCSYRCKSSSQLTIHLRTHTGIFKDIHRFLYESIFFIKLRAIFLKLGYFQSVLSYVYYNFKFVHMHEKALGYIFFVSLNFSWSPPSNSSLFFNVDKNPPSPRGGMAEIYIPTFISLSLFRHEDILRPCRFFSQSLVSSINTQVYDIVIFERKGFSIHNYQIHLWDYENILRKFN